MQPKVLAFAALLLLLSACRKKLETYTIEVKTYNTASARVWYTDDDGYDSRNTDYSGYTTYSRLDWQKHNLSLLTLALNPNDAVIHSVIIEYEDAKGKLVRLEGSNNNVGDGYTAYSTDIQVPAGKTLRVAATATQTGLTIPLGSRQIKKGARLSDSKVTLSIAVSKGGELVGYKHNTELKRVSTDVEVTPLSKKSRKAS